MTPRASPKTKSVRTQPTPTRLVPKSSVNRALNALGDRWSLLIVQEAFLGATRFEEFHARLGGARSTLSSRLQALERHRIIEKRPQREDGARMVYHLTPQGLDLFDSMMLMWGWGVRWGVGGGQSPTIFIHKDCGKPMLPEARCRHCGDLLTLHTCTYTAGPGEGLEALPFQRMHRKRQTSDETPALELVDLLGDRWTALVVSIQYFGVHRFDEIQARLGIASNILTDRLRMLEGAGIFERRLYELSPPRYEYRLTQKGMDLYPHALTMMTWADHWLKDKDGPPVRITHNCGAAMDAKVACSACQGELSIDTVAPKMTKARTGR